MSIFVDNDKTACSAEKSMWFSEQLIGTFPSPERVIDREAAAHAVVTELKRQLNEHGAAMLSFKTKYRVRSDKFGRLLGVESASVGGFAEIEIAWRKLLHKRDGLISEWHAALHRWAEAKEAAKGICQ